MSAVLEHVERLEGEVIEQEQVDADEFAHLLVVAGVEARRFQPLVQPVTSFEVHADAPAARDVPECSGQEGLAHPDRAQDEGVAGLLDEAQ